MAARQGSHEGRKKPWLFTWTSERRDAPGRACAQTVWAIASLLACSGTSAAQCSSLRAVEHRAYDLLITRQSDTYHPRTYRGLLATDGRRHRIAFYWRDPTAECEETSALAFSDFLFHSGNVSYWHHKDPNEEHTVSLEPWSPAEVGQFPIDNKFESILQAILQVVVHNRTAPLSSENLLETASFFQNARGRHPFARTVAPATRQEAQAASAATSGQGNFSVLNRLPFGRKYSKRMDQKGSIVWQMSKAAVPMQKVSVAVRPRRLLDTTVMHDAFDPNTLGRWSAVPRAYRKYWSFKRQSVALRRTPSIPEAQRLYADIDGCLREPLPDDVNLALHRLRFTTSLETDSCEVMTTAGSEYFRVYVRLAEQPVEKIVVELGRIGKEVRRKLSDAEASDLILPLLSPLVDLKVFADSGFVVEAILGEIRRRGRPWSWYGQLVAERVQRPTRPNAYGPLDVPDVGKRAADVREPKDSEEN